MLLVLVPFLIFLFCVCVCFPAPLVPPKSWGEVGEQCLEGGVPSIDWSRAPLGSDPSRIGCLAETVRHLARLHGCHPHQAAAVGVLVKEEVMRMLWRDLHADPHERPRKPCCPSEALLIEIACKEMARSASRLPNPSELGRPYMHNLLGLLRAIQTEAASQAGVLKPDLKAGTLKAAPTTGAAGPARVQEAVEGSGVLPNFGSFRRDGYSPEETLTGAAKEAATVLPVEISLVKVRNKHCLRTGRLPSLPKQSLKPTRF